MYWKYRQLLDESLNDRYYAGIMTVAYGCRLNGTYWFILYLGKWQNTREMMLKFWIFLWWENYFS